MTLLDTILPWRSNSTDEQTGDNYEERVKDRCDHDWEESVESEGILNLRDAHLEDGFIVIPVFERVASYCEKCGQQYVETKDYVAESHWGYTRQSGKVAVPVAFQLDADTSLADALYEPVRDEADYAVDQDGEIEAIEGEGEGRVLVNQSERAEGASD